jgi:hypothetical protein
MIQIFKSTCVSGGAGFGITYAVVSIIVGLNFEKYRAVATAITMSGSGFGTVSFKYIFMNIFLYSFIDC